MKKAHRGTGDWFLDGLFSVPVGWRPDWIPEWGVVAQVTRGVLCTCTH